MKLNKLIIAATAFAVVASSPAWSQTFDDDIYYDASKDKKKVATVKQQNRQSGAPASFPAADTYSTELTSSTRDVDEYNRRGFFAIPDSTANDSIINTEINGDAFANTRRIERFYNPDVVIENPDATVAEYYYSNQPAEINIYINNPYPYYGGSWLYDPWYYGPGYNSLWYYGGLYNPWTWGWGPSWSWSWNWGPSWAWGPSWGWGQSWGWIPGPIAPQPTRPQPPHGGNYAGSYRRAASASGGRYVGSGSTLGHRAPGTASESNWNIGNIGTRPGSGATATYRPGASGSNRGGGNSLNATGRRPGSSGATNSNSSVRQNQNSFNNRNNTNTYNRSTDNTSTYRSNGSSFGGGGSSRGGSFGNGGGGSFRGGAGGGGRRR